MFFHRHGLSDINSCFRFADTNLRNYGVECIEQLSDDELSDYLTQLIQVSRLMGWGTIAVNLVHIL